MHTLIRHEALRAALPAEAAAMFVSLVAAEFFYKFHSFTLECAAFLATWYALSYAASLARRGRASAH